MKSKTVASIMRHVASKVPSVDGEVLEGEQAKKAEAEAAPDVVSTLLAGARLCCKYLGKRRKAVELADEAAGVLAAWDRAGSAPDLEQAVASVPAGSERVSFTDWRAVRMRATRSPDPVAAGRVARLTERAYELDLASASSIEESGSALAENFGFGPGNATWEAYAVAPAGASMVLRMDDSVDFDTVARIHGEELATKLRDLTLALYARAAGIAAERGIILADTKFEFGRRPDGTLVLADEVLTPDSSRFWDASLWQPGKSLPSFDKQYVRDWLAHDSGWDRASDEPPPPLPADVVAATRARYVEAYERLAGEAFG